MRNLDSTGILMNDDAMNVMPMISRFDRAKVMGFDDKTSEVYGDVRFRAPEVI